MAYEKEMIAAMNNPNTLFAWQCAEVQAKDAWMWRRRANQLKTKLEDACVENDAVHRDLGEAYESIRIRDMRFLDDVGQYAHEAAHWKRLYENAKTFLCFLLCLWLIAAWVVLQGRL